MIIFGIGIDVYKEIIDQWVNMSLDMHNDGQIEEAQNILKFLISKGMVEKNTKDSIQLIVLGKQKGTKTD